MDITKVLYPILVGMCGFTLGLSLVLAYAWIRMALRSRGAQYWFWALTMLGYACVIAALFPLVLQAKQIDAPFNATVIAFFVGITLKSIAFLGLFIWHRNHEPPL